MVEDPWPVIATLSRIDQPLTLPSKAARTIVTVGSVPVTLLVPSTSADESGASVHSVQTALMLACTAGSSIWLHRGARYCTPCSEVSWAVSGL